jgi:hypothetical protein
MTKRMKKTEPQSGNNLSNNSGQSDRRSFLKEEQLWEQR